MLLGVQVEGRIEEFAHDETLPHLNSHFLPLERGKQDESDDRVEGKELAPDRNESLLHQGGEVAFSDEEHVAPCVDSGDEDSGFPETLGVVHAVHNRIVLFPLVFVHILMGDLIKIIIKAFNHTF